MLDLHIFANIMIIVSLSILWALDTLISSSHTSELLGNLYAGSIHQNENEVKQILLMF